MDLLLALLTGLASSLHCVGMCGSIVLALSAAQPSARRLPSLLPTHLSYHLGRVIGYALLGALAGSLGGLLGGLARIGSVLSLVGGALMILMGLLLLLRPGAIFTPDPAKKSLHALFSRLVRLGGAESGWYIGLLTPLLPCGLLYSMLVRSLSASSPWEGAAIMAAFALGIVPALLLTGLLGGFLPARVRAAGNLVAAALVVLLGLVLLARGAGVALPWMGWMH